jgi:hypothetical protein
MRAEETIQQTITADLYAYWRQIKGAHVAPTLIPATYRIFSPTLS